MALYYSASAHGFFDDALHAVIPADARPVTAARHRELLDAQATGATIEAGDNGKPRIRRPVVTTAMRRVALARQVKRETARRIEAVAPIWRQLNDQRAPSPAGAARFAAIDAIRAASDAIEAEIDQLGADALAGFAVADHPLWPAE